LNPTTIPGCVLWLDAADPLNTGTAPANGTSITTWYDKSGGNRNGTASGTITYNTTGLNSKPAMSLTGSQNFQGAVSITGNSLTVLIVCTMNSSTGNNGRFISLAATGAADYNSTSYMCFVRSSSGVATSTTYRNNANISTITNPITTYTPYLFETWFDGTNMYITTQSGNTTSISSTASIGTFGVANFSIGSTFISDGTGYFNGFMSEILVYNTALTTSQRQQLEGYLSRKWGLQSNLPSSHPYYNSLQRVSMNPAAIPGCVLWLDASDPLNTGTAPSNGTSITTWYDKSGGNNNATTSTGTVTYNTTGLNSKPAMTFTNTQYMLGPINSPVTGTTLTILAIVSMNSSTTTNGRALSLSQLNGLDYGSVTSVAFARRNGTTGIIPYRKDVTLSNNPPSYSTPYLFECWFDGTNEYATTQMGNTTSIASIASTGNFNITNFAIGNECYTAAGDYFNGFMSEILVYNTALSTAQRQLVEDYLSWKWGLQANLPTTHPYYNSLIIDKTTYKPTSIPGCVLWFDADDPFNTGITPTNGTSITTWYDKSGGNRNATASGTITYNRTGLNNKAAMTFTGTQLLTGSVSITGTTLTILAIVNMNTSSQLSARIIAFSTGSGVNDYTSSSFMTFARQSGNGLRGYRNGVQVANEPPTGSVPYLFETWYDGTKNYNTVQIGNSTTIATVDSSGNFGISYFAIGSNTNTSDLPGFLTGFISEILVYNTALSTSQRQEVEAYLSYKWGLQTNLPNTHPYYTSPNPLELTYFSPTSIPGCALWFDADDSTTIVQSASKVSQWNDKSGNGYSVIQPTSANQPTYTANLLNGKAGISLSNTSWLYQFGNNMPNFTSSSAMSVFCVVRNDTSLPANGWSVVNTMWFNQSNSGTIYRYHLSFNNATTTGVASVDNTLTKINQSTTVGYGANAIIGLSWSTTSGLIYVNGNTATFSGQTLVNGNTSSLMFNIGDARQANYMKDIVIYELIGFNTQLTTYQQQQIEGYLALKWGLQTNLPNTHPYYFSSNSLALTSSSKSLALTSLTPNIKLPYFSPKDINGCALWFDAADSTTIVQSASKVSQWNDKSGNGYSVIQPTSANQPTYTTNLLNGKAGVVLSNTSWLYQFGNNMPAFTGSPAMSVFCVARNDTSLPATGWGVVNTMWFNQSNTGTIFRYHLSFDNATTTGVTSIYNTNTIFNQNTTVGYGANAIIGLSWSSTSSLVYVNGTTTTSSGQTLVNGNTSSLMFNIGDSRQGNYMKDVVIYELIGFNTQLTTYQQQKIEGYLAWKWGLQTNLPSTHPYYSYPPTTNTPLYNPVSIPGCLLWLDAADKGSLGLFSSTTPISVTIPNSTNATSYNWTNGSINWTSSASSYQNTSSGGALNLYPYYLFNNGTPSLSNRWVSANSSGNYSTSTRAYTGSASTTVLNSVGTVNGDWVQIQSSVPVIMNNFTFSAFSASAAAYCELPGTFYICGSIDATNWYPLIYINFTGTQISSGQVSPEYIIRTNATVGTQSIGGITGITWTNSNGTYQTWGNGGSSYTYFRLITTYMMGTLTTSGTNDGWLSLGAWTPYFTLVSAPISTSVSSFSWVYNDINWKASANSYQNTYQEAYPYSLFNNSTPTTYNRWVSANASGNYSTSTRAYTGTASTKVLNSVGTVNGDWVQIQSSVPLIMNDFTLSSWYPGGGGGYSEMPGTFYICGSIDADNWYPLIYINFTGTQISSGLISPTYTIPKTITAGTQSISAITSNSSGTYQTWGNGGNNYTYFRLITTYTMGNLTTGGSNDGWLSFGKWTPNFTTPSSYVSRWNDKSNSGYDMVQSISTSQPVYGTMSNSKPGLNLASGKYMSNTTIAFPTNYSIFAVGYVGSTTDWARLLSGATNIYLVFGSGPSGVNFSTFLGNGTSWNDYIDNSPTNANTSLCLMEMTNNNTSTGLIPYFNGTAQTAKNGATVAFTGLSIGACVYQGGLTTQYWNGYVAEILIFNSVLTTTQRQYIEGYLANKWSIQSRLPSNHPYYKITPPTYNLFTPNSINGCILWLDAADNSSIVFGTITPNSTAATTASWTNNGITWTASASENTNSGCMYYSAFNFSSYVTNGDAGAALGWQNGNINGTTPWNYNGTGSTTYYINSTTTNTKSGGWLQIQSSTLVMLNSYTFTCPGGNTGPLIGRIPGKYTIVGSTNGTTWYNLVDVIFSGLPPNTSYTTGVQTTGSILLSTLGNITASTTANTNSTTTTYGYQTDYYTYFRIIFTNTLAATVSALYNVYSTNYCQFGWTPYFISTNITNISQWNDKSGTGNNMIQATSGSQPVLSNLSNGIQALNLASSKYMINTTISFPTNYSVFIVGYTTTNGYGRILHGPYNSDCGLCIGSGNVNTNLMSMVGTTPTSWSSSEVNTSSNGYSTSVASLCIMEMTTNNTTNGLLTYVNGYQLDAKNGTNNGFTGLSIGAGVFSGGSTSQFWNGYICEVLVFNSVLSTTNRQYVEGYLAYKWGIQSSLPVTHPYYQFKPTSITGCTLWLDATDNTTITQASSVVSQWNDKSGTGNNMTQATSGSRPVLSNLSNGMQALNFASGKFMSNTTISFPTNYSVFIVGYVGSTTTWARLLNGTTSSDAYLFLGSGPSGVNFSTFVGNGTTWNDTNDNTPTNANTSLCLMEMTNNNTTTGLLPYFNGTALTAKNGSTVTFTGLCLGSINTGQPWNGYICEVLVFNSVLSTTNRQNVEGYLANKWGIQSSLPVAHPYYSPAPVISTTAPTAPTNIIVSNATSSSLTVNFTAPTGQITNYKPYINGALATNYYGSPNSFTINNLTNGSYIDLRLSNLYGTSPATTSLITNNPASSGLYARYTPNNYNPATNIWSDTTGTYNLPSSQITNTGLSLVTNSSNTYGAINSLVALQGTTSSIIGFTTANITNYTLFYVARYVYPITNAIGRECLLTASGGEFWMSGFYSGATAAAHHNTAVISNLGQNPYDNNWFISTDSYSLYKANGINYGAAVPGGGTGGDTYLPPLWINGSMTNNAGGPSHFQIADLIIYNSYLSTTDISNVEIYLSNLYGIPLVTSPTISSITSNTATLTFNAPADDNTYTTYTASTGGIVYGTTTGSNYTVLQTNVFSYTGSNQTITVPTGTAFVTAQLWGAGGGGAGNGSTGQTSGVCLNDILGSGGGGGYTSANLVVTAGTTLTIIVGQAGTVSAVAGQATNTYGGGGGCASLNGDTNWRNTSGGGRSAIQISAADIITAGGGGGGGHLARLSYTVPAATYLTGGAGGGSIGGTGGQGDSAGQTWDGAGGTQTGGGAAGSVTSGGTSATAGTQYQGGTGNQYSAGGGGGYYGGGGGQYYQPTVQYFGAGGGGSSYVNTTYLKSSSDFTLAQASGSTVAGNRFLPSAQQGLIGGGGAGSTSGGTGQNGYVVLTFYQAATVSPTKTISLTGLSSLLTNNVYPITVSVTSTDSGATRLLPVASLLTLPVAPVIGTVTVSGTTATVPFTPISGNGTITNYTVISNPAGFSVKGTSSPIVVYGLAQNTTYTFTMTTTNATGTSSASTSSNSITTGSQIGAVYTTQTNGTVSTIGAITSTGGVKTISFTTSAVVGSAATFVGTFTTTVALSNVNICVVSGGAGGGQNNGGGGGGGAVLIYETGRSNAATIAAGTTIYIYVGSGGEGSKVYPGTANAKWTQYALSGSNSYISVVSGSITASSVNLGSTITASNLGYAPNPVYNSAYTTQWQKSAVQTNNASHGAGAGGGGGATAIFNTSSNINYGGLGNGSGGNGGNAYGNGSQFSYNNGGGGGGGGVNGGAGGNYYASGNGGAGGSGTQFQATGVYYGGGGGGGVAANAAGGGVGGAGGTGGGGAGSKSATPGNGTANTGGGGGGAGNGSYSGGNGANGIVVISFTY